jgi:hypothetical protein
MNDAQLLSSFNRVFQAESSVETAGENTALPPQLI